MEGQKIKVALVDDHVLLRNGLASLVKSFDDYTVLFEADNGQHFIDQLNKSDLPDLVLMDISMPVKDGYETSLWLKQNYPDIKILALSMFDNESAIIRMLKNGARGYILKDIHPKEFKAALDSVITKGFYYSELVTGKLIHVVSKLDDADTKISEDKITEKEIVFLRLICSELTYKEIADKMNVSPRTVDGYRDTLFEKVNVKTRVGLVMYAIKNGIVLI